jgi:hypothetical protein
MLHSGISDFDEWLLWAEAEHIQQTNLPDLRDDRKLMHAPERCSFLKVLRLHIQEVVIPVAACRAAFTMTMPKD